MNSTNVNMGDMLDVAERYQRMFVKPLVDAVTSQLDDHLKTFSARLDTVEGTVKSQGAAVSALQGNQKKALVGYGVFTSALAAVLAGSWSWIKSHFKITG